MHRTGEGRWPAALAGKCAPMLQLCCRAPPQAFATAGRSMSGEHPLVLPGQADGASQEGQRVVLSFFASCLLGKGTQGPDQGKIASMRSAITCSHGVEPDAAAWICSLPADKPGARMAAKPLSHVRQLAHTARCTPTQPTGCVLICTHLFSPQTSSGALPLTLELSQSCLGGSSVSWQGQEPAACACLILSHMLQVHGPRRQQHPVPGIQPGAGAAHEPGPQPCSFACTFARRFPCGIAPCSIVCC